MFLGVVICQSEKFGKYNKAENGMCSFTLIQTFEFFSFA